MLIVGIVYHTQFMRGLRDQRRDMVAEGLIHGQSGFPVSFTMIVAVLLLVVGLLAIVGMTSGVGPFT
jgi:putative membrane protein